MLSASFLTCLLLVPGAPQVPAAPATAAAVAAEITKGVTAYNAQDLKYYEELRRSSAPTRSLAGAPALGQYKHR
jgi:hypothetical protein